jgi:superfamily II DNA/RNA helicase
MLDMGFIPDIERICKLLPFTRQTLFFSATMPPEIQRLADKFLHHPERIEVAPQATAAATIVQRLKKAPDDPASKREALRALMRETDVKNAIIFCNRKKDVGILYRSLLRHGFSVGALHGDMEQHQRTATLDAFRNGQIAFLAASDVAARGLDIPEVSHIFNYDVPIHPEDYVHRIGRTGRAGREGFAAMLVTPKDYKALKAIEKLLRQEIPWIDGAPSEAEQAEAETRPNENGRHRRGGRSRRGKRGSGAQSGHAARQQQVPNGHEAKKRDESRHDHRHHQHKQQKHHGERKPSPVVHGAPAERPQGHAPQPPRGNQQGMGDHVPAFMMRPVRVT